MRPNLGLALAIAPLSLLAACGGGTSTPAVTDDGWVVLFDGSSFDHLNVLGDANWRIEEASVMADSSSGASFLVTPDAYSDFELELEFWVNTEANSGIFLRCQDPQAITDTSCYEVNIFDTRSDQTYRTGGIVNLASPAEFVYTGGPWNRYEISAVGNRLQVTLNGRDLIDVEDSQYSSGPIALQYGSGIVRFRNVRVNPL